MNSCAGCGKRIEAPEIADDFEPDICPSCREMLELGCEVSQLPKGKSLRHWHEEWEVVGMRDKRLYGNGDTALMALREAKK